MMNDMTRRSFLTAAAGAAGAAALGCAGCGGAGTPAGSDGAAGTATATGSAAASGGDLLTQVRNRGELVFATEGTWSPWTFHNEADELTGYDIEVARAIAGELGVEASFAEGAGTACSPASTRAVRHHDQRRVGHAGARGAVRLHRALRLQPHRGHHHGGLRHRAMEDLDGRRTANTLGSSYATLAESHGATNTGVDDFNQTIELLQQGRIDATLNDEVVFYDYMAAHPDAPAQDRGGERASPRPSPSRCAAGEATAGLLDGHERGHRHPARRTARSRALE